MRISKDIATFVKRVCYIHSVVFFCLLTLSLPAWAVETTSHSLDGDIESARRDIANNQTKPAAHSKLGYLLIKKGALNEAFESFDEALKLNPRYHEAQTGKGIVWSRRGDYKQAEQVLKAALKLNPDPVRTHYELGLVYEKLGDLNQAMMEFKEGISKSQQGRR